MVDVAPEFESKDVLGKTIHYNANASTVAASVPAVVVSKISNALVRNPSTNAVTDIIYVAMDNGATFITLKRGEYIIWAPKNDSSNAVINQIKIKSNAASVAYEAVLDFEP
jgi:hypothetical protein